MKSFFELWANTQAEKKFGPDMIFNLDDTGIATVQNIPKVIAARGLKQVGQITAAERGTLVTVCCCVTAVGKSLPPVMIFSRVHYKDHMIKGAPPGTLGLATQSAWMNAELFPRVLDHSIKQMGCSIQNPAVLFMDNHDCHLGNDIIEMARANGLSTITFPPHTSHKLQPLDVTVYGPLMCHYKKAVDEWNLSHPGSRITIYDLPECFGRAFFRTLSSDYIASGFRKTGIWPQNSEVFSDGDFLAATVFSNNTVVHPQADGGAPIQTNRNVISATTDDNQPEALTAYSSFAALTKIQPLPKRKAGDQSKPCGKRAAVGEAQIEEPEDVPTKEENSCCQEDRSPHCLRQFR